MPNIITPEEFMEILKTLERKRINITLMERKIRKAMDNVVSAEYSLVRDAENSGFADQIPDLRSRVYPALRQMRKDAGAAYGSDFGA